jgi:diguanylate cyclase (GGDEF)-like protein
VPTAQPIPVATRPPVSIHPIRTAAAAPAVLTPAAAAAPATVVNRLPLPRPNPAPAEPPALQLKPPPSRLPAPNPSIPLLALPLLIGLWLILATKTATRVAGLWRLRDARLRRLAAALDLDPEQAVELTQLPAPALTRIEDTVESAAFDDLTGVLRRGPGLASLTREVARAARTQAPLTVAFIDVDGLKQVNDSLGHAAGDALIRAVSASLERRLRAADLVFRYGGDEFVCVLPDTRPEQAERVLSRIQDENKEIGADFSVGLAAYRPGDTSEGLLSRADAALYTMRRAAEAEAAAATLSA